MKNFFKFIALAAVVFCGLAVMQPEEFRVERSALMAAPAEKIFEQVNNLQRWEAWDPWAKLDPNATATFEGPAAGVGAKMSWAGNFEVGKGSMTITESRPAELVQFDLEFKEPFAAKNSARFTFAKEGEQTQVTWAMWGKKDFLAKAMGLVFDCENQVGGQFDKGLASLRSIVERGSH